MGSFHFVSKNRVLDLSVVRLAEFLGEACAITKTLACPAITGLDKKYEKTEGEKISHPGRQVGQIEGIFELGSKRLAGQAEVESTAAPSRCLVERLVMSGGARRDELVN